MGVDKVFEYKKLTANTGYFSGPVNAGLIETSAGLYLIDSGNDDDEGLALAKEIESVFPGKKLLAIINTHGHSDHSGGNAVLKKRFSSEIWTTECSSHIMQIPIIVGSIYCGGMPCKKMAESKLVGPKSPSTDRILLENQVIDLDEIRMEFIPLPGHFFDQIGVYVTDKNDSKNVFFLADGFFGKELLKKSWILFMTEPESFRKSVESIQEVKADYYVPGHGSLVLPEEFKPLSELNIMITLELEFIIRRILSRKPVDFETLLKKVADETEIKLSPLQFFLISTTLRSYLSSMESRGLVYFEVIDNRMLWHSA